MPTPSASPSSARRTSSANPKNSTGLDGLIIPGGESTTFLKHLERAASSTSLNTFVHTKPAFGTCAGCHPARQGRRKPPAASASARSTSPSNATPTAARTTPPSSRRNRTPGGPTGDGLHPRPAHRSPRPRRQTLAPRDSFPSSSAGHILAATFHPELTADPRVHQLFLDIVRENS